MGVEPLLGEIEKILAHDNPPYPPGVLDQLESDRTILRASLQSPDPDPVTIERATVRVTRVLAPEETAVAEHAVALEEAGLDLETAQEVASDIAALIETAESLGDQNATTDIAVANELTDKLADLALKLADKIPDPEPGDEDPEPVEEKDPKKERRITEWANHFAKTIIGEGAKKLIAQLATAMALVAATAPSQTAAILQALREIVGTIFGFA